MTQRLLLALVVTLLSACEHGIDMKGTVIAPVDVQQLFSAAAPGQLFVVATPPSGSGALRARNHVFCMPSVTERRIPIDGFGFGCATAGEVQVSAFAVPRQADQIDCVDAGRVLGPSSTFAPDSFDADQALASGSTTATLELDGGGSCRDGSFDFAVTLAALSPH